MLDSFLCGDFLLHFYLGTFSKTSRAGFNFMSVVFYTSHADFILIRGVSLTHPVLVLFCAGSLSDTSSAAFIFMRGVSLTDRKLPSFLCVEFLLHNPYWLLFMRGVSLAHPVLS